MEEIRRHKIEEAIKKTADIYKRLGLNMTEIEIVSRSHDVAAKVIIAEKQLETEAEDAIKERQTSTEIKVIKWMPTICSTLAIVLAVISLILRLK